MNVDSTAAPACSLDARDFKERMAWLAALNATSLHSRVRDGRTVVLSYAAAAAPAVAQLVARERECCAFLSFDVQTTADTVEVTIGVPAEHADSADALLAPFLDDIAAAATSTCCGGC